MEDIQNRQRPLENGQGSFGLVYKTAKRFSEKGYPFDIRTTITDDSVNRLKEIYEFFQREFKPRTINFEPLYECGRCHTSKSKEPDYQEYVANFIGLIKSIPPEKETW